MLLFEEHTSYIYWPCDSVSALHHPARVHTDLFPRHKHNTVHDEDKIECTHCLGRITGTQTLLYYAFHYIAPARDWRVGNVKVAAIPLTAPSPRATLKVASLMPCHFRYAVMSRPRDMTVKYSSAIDSAAGRIL